MMPSSVAQLVYEDSAERLHIKLEIKIGDPLIKIRELIIHSDRKIMKTKIMLNNKEISHKYLYEDEKKILRILLEEEIYLKIWCL
jgi:aspartyl aminopeptidase